MRARRPDGGVVAFALVVVAAVVAALTWTPSPRAVAAADGCVACHAQVTGLGTFHDPARIGCASCHLGDASARTAGAAHEGMLRIPGNLADADRSCGRQGCHVDAAARVRRSIMTTMAGVIATQRRVLGEANAAAATPPHPGDLGHGPADSVLRELCVSCHLGQPKDEPGPLGEDARGGGCNACHLVYDGASAQALAARLATPAAERRAAPHRHPALAATPGNGHCFGCHSRSGRVATSYEGWHEIRGEPPPDADRAKLRRLADGRWFAFAGDDVHHARGLDCVDCHTAREVMGAGEVVAHKREQQRIACTDCHARTLASVGVGAVDGETRMLLALRRWTVPADARFATAARGDVLDNVLVDAQGRGQLRRKRTGEVLPLPPPRPACTDDKAHARLACATCHSAWAPRCATCHTAFDPSGEGFDHVDQRWRPGTWNETAGPYEAALPTLGVVTHRDASGRETSAVATFVPGMVMTFDRNRDPRRAPDVLFRRLYAPVSAHTIRREARSCASCHADPVALGYGKGTLRFERARSGGAWRFAPAAPTAAQDGLPADAWIGFLREGRGLLSPRAGARPFTVAEQRRVLRIGACLTCHDGGSPAMRLALADVDAALARRTPRCAQPGTRCSR